MAKYLGTVSYTAEGAKALLSGGGSARKKIAQTAVKSVGGKLEAFYFAFGSDDALVIFDAPDHAAAAAIALAVSATGLLRLETTVLLTPEEIDEAAKRSVSPQPPKS
jgi:uncharacterized protein with GYD domain